MGNENSYSILENCERYRRSFLRSFAFMDELTQLKSRVLQRPVELNIERDPDEEQIMEELNYLHDAPQEEAEEFIRTHMGGRFMHPGISFKLSQELLTHSHCLASDIVTGYVRSCLARCKSEEFPLVQRLNRIFPVKDFHLNYYTLDKLFLYVRKVAQDRGSVVDEYSRRAGKSLLELQGYLPADAYNLVAEKVFEDLALVQNLSWMKVAVLLMILANTVIGLIDHQGGISNITEEMTSQVEVLINTTASSIYRFVGIVNHWDNLQAANLNAPLGNFEVVYSFEAETIPEPYHSNFEDYIPKVSSPVFKGYIPPPLPALTTLAFTKLPGTTIREKRDLFAGEGVHSLHQFDYFD